MLDPEDIAQRTLNYLNSDIYVLVRQMMMEPLKEMVQKGMSVEEIQGEKMKVNEEHIKQAYSKIRPSILVQELGEYKEWREKF